MNRIIKAQILNDRMIEVIFDNGVSGTFKFDHFFTPRNDSMELSRDDYFSKMYIDPETESLTWPNGYDICPDVIYSIITGEKIIVDGNVVFDPN
ncbi:MAG: hypothetical protein Fur0010_27290 [Bdellovibrio sp.]